MLRPLLVAGITFLAAALTLASPAAADDAVVILDRGMGARAESHRHEQTALRLVEALHARDFDVRLALYGTRPDGRVRASRLSGDLADRLARAGAREGWRHEAPTDPRHALEVSLRGYEGAGPLLVVLVGPFATSTESDGATGPPRDEADQRDGGSDPDGGAADDAGADDEDRSDGPAEEALTAWEENAPPSTRVFAPDLSPETLELIARARGVVTRGAIVLAVGESIATPAAWSPLTPSGPESALHATLRVPLEVLLVGPGPSAPVLRGTSSDGRGEVTAATSDARREDHSSGPREAPTESPTEQSPQPPAERRSAGGSITFTVRRPQPAGESTSRVETVSFAATADAAVLWLVEPPQPRTVQWSRLRPDARAGWFSGGEDVPRAPVDAARPLDADPLLVGRPLTRICRVEHTRVGETPAWQVKAAEGELPDGLTVSVGDVVNLTEELAYRELEIRFEASPGEPGSIEGSLMLEAAGHPSRIQVPYRLVVPPGRVVARLDASEAPRRLPAAADARPWTLQVEEQSPNAPQLVRVEAVLDPPELGAALTARLEGGGGVDVVWDLSRPLELRPGRRYDLHIDLAPGVSTAAGTLEVHLPEQRGVEGRAEGRGRIVTRSPRLVVVEEPWSYRMDGGEMIADPPLVLAVDADGGTGDWRLALLEATPTVTMPPHAPARFGLRPAGPGRWTLVPDDAWQGARGDTFAGREETVPVHVAWARGDSPGTVAVRIVVEPRWGRAGWILAGLAVLALALGLWGLTQMRAAPVDGTLLYQVEGLESTVGRLDLAPTGRRATPIHTDAAGRLVLGPSQDRTAGPVAVVRPTRVGGLLELPVCTPPERHLLVDGLTVRAGRHRIRYVSARPGDTTVPAVTEPGEDLLGPEFDLPSGRIDALERE